MKRKQLLLLLILMSFISHGQEETKIDTVAVDLLDKMSGVIGELNATSFQLHTVGDVENDYFQHESSHNFHKITMVGPDKMTIHSTGDKGNRSAWYNGDIFTYYSFDENNYVRLEAPDNIIKTIDSIHNTFDIDFPAADVFYPTLTDDILDNFDNVKFLGIKTIDGQKCFHIMAYNEEMSYQLWIENEATFLPKKYLFIEKEKGKSEERFEGTFSNWVINPDLPSEIFEFTPPKSAKLISILSKL